MMTGIFGAVLSPPLRHNVFRGRRLILDKFNVGHLCLRRWWHEEEKGQDKTNNHHRVVEDIRAGCGFLHFQNIFRIYMFAVNHGRAVVSFAHGVGGKGKDQAKEDDRNHTEKVAFRYDLIQNPVGLDVEVLTELKKRPQNRIGKSENKEYKEVDGGDAKE